MTTERFELALKGSPVVLFCQDLDLRYTWIYNPGLGYEASEVVGRFDADIFERAEDAAATEAIKREVIRTGKPSAERFSFTGRVSIGTTICSSTQCSMRQDTSRASAAPRST